MSRRNPLSRFHDPGDIDPESRNKVLLIGGISAVVIVAFALILVGYYMDRVQSRGNAVFAVGDRTYSYDFLEDRVNAAVARGTFDFQNVQLGISTVVANVQNEELFRLLGREHGFTATDEEVDVRMKEYLRVPPEIPTNEFARILRDELRILGLSLGQFEDQVEALVYEDKLRDMIREDLPDEMEQVNLRLIVAPSQEAIDDAQARIQGGEAFEDVAAEVSTHSSAAEGGDFGWTPRGILPEVLEEAAFDMEPGQVSDVLQSSASFFLLKVEERETRELDELTRDDLVTRRLGDMLDEAVETYGIENFLTFDQVNRIAAQIKVPGG